MKVTSCWLWYKDGVKVRTIVFDNDCSFTYPLNAWTGFTNIAITKESFKPLESYRMVLLDFTKNGDLKFREID